MMPWHLEVEQQLANKTWKEDYLLGYQKYNAWTTRRDAQSGTERAATQRRWGQKSDCVPSLDVRMVAV